MKGEQPSGPQPQYDNARRRRREKLRAASTNGATEAVSLEDFYAYMPMHSYLFIPCRALWPGASVNARLPRVQIYDEHGQPKRDEDGKLVTVSPSHWLDQNRPVEQMTWAPGEPLLIEDRLIAEGGWFDRPGCRVFNQYRPPSIELGDPAKADPWLDHAHKVYPNDAAHIILWLAHRRQRPYEKINHCLVLGGAPGIGKDTLLEGAARAVGPWNVREIGPQNLFETFTDYLKAVILRISESHDLGDCDRFSFYERTKTCMAAPPEVLRINEKNVRPYYVPNCCSPIITTNYKTDSLYLPADDRRHYVAWSELREGCFASKYWAKLWGWYDKGGDCHVAAYLDQLDLSKFDPKAPPPKTPAFWAIVDANRAPEDAELADVLDKLGTREPVTEALVLPDAVTLAQVQAKAVGSFDEWLRDRRNRRQIPHRFEKCGYVPVRNGAADSGLWVINGTRQVVYAKAGLSPRDQLDAVEKLTKLTRGRR
jgi:hypothetical protein